MVLTVIAANAQKFQINDKNAELRTVGGFTAIEASSAIDIYISQGMKPEWRSVQLIKKLRIESELK